MVFDSHRPESVQIGSVIPFCLKTGFFLFWGMWGYYAVFKNRIQMLLSYGKFSKGAKRI